MSRNPDSPPRRPSFFTTPASPPSLNEHPSPPPLQPLRTSSSNSSLRPIAVVPGASQRTRSRSPSPSPTFPSSSFQNDASPSATAALMQAGLGLVGSLPPSPALVGSPLFDQHEDEDEVEQLEDPSPGSASPLDSRGLSSASEMRKGGAARARAPSVVGFVEPEVPLRERERGRRERKSSFLGLGFGGGGGGSGSTTGDEGEGGGRGSFARRISFGAFSGAASGSVDLPDPVPSTSRPSPPIAPLPLPPTAPTPRKASGTKALLRRAKSFGTTSPVLGSSQNSGTFPTTSQPVPQPPAPRPLPSPVPPRSPVLRDLPRLSTSAVSLHPSSAASASAHNSPSASGFSTPLTPSSPYPYLYASSSSSLQPPPPASSIATASTSTMVLPEPLPSQPHRLLMGTAPPPASSSPASLTPNEHAQPRRRSADEQARPSEAAVATSAKGKEKEQTPKRVKTRRATLGGLFGRKDSKAAVHAGEREASLESQRLSAETGSTGGGSSVGGGPVFDSPTSSPALDSGVPSSARAGAGLRENSCGGGSEANLPSLPSLPSLQLSSNPYRMSWAFGSSSPSTSPSKNGSGSPARRLSTAISTPLPSPPPSRNASTSRPSLSITTTPPNASPSPSSPTKPSPLSSVAPSPRPASPSSRPPLNQAHTLPLPIPPPFHSAQSSDSAATLLPNAATPSTLRGLSRAHSASSPPLLRRSNSYVPPPSSSPSLRDSYAPLARSPLSSPTMERSDPLQPAPLSPFSSGGGSPSLAKTLIRTRQARSHSDASDRRSPSSPSAAPTNFAYGGARNMVVGGMGYPAGGGYFAQAHQKVGSPSARTSAESGTRRPSTGDSGVTSGGGGRTSVFGSLGSFFHSSSASSSSAALASGNGSGGFGSQGMSRSSSAATATTASAAGTPGLEQPSEFGALFGGGSGDAGRGSASVARPGTGRKRGLSVGAGIGSLFGHAGRDGRESSLPPPTGSPSTSPARQQAHGRHRSGSASSAQTSGSGAGGLVPPGGVGGRMRALTDPNRRFSLVGGGSSTGLVPPGQGSRPGTSDGAMSAGSGNGGRSRGGSLSAATGVGKGLPDRPPPPKERKVPKPRTEEGETPEEWVRRLLQGEPPRIVLRRKEHTLQTEERLEEEPEDEQAEEKDVKEVEEPGTDPLPKGEITRAVAASSDAFHTSALAAYLRLFPFHHLALDIALRVFLSAASLPSETQQIDRVMEAFARRWCECNPGCFAGKQSKEEDGKKDAQESDVPYVLAFSMVMLNTDHFNPNAKSKMTKADYVKNTRIDGLAPEILEYLYDQITLAPFVFVDSNSTDDSSSLFAPTSSSSLLGGSIGPSGSAMPSTTGAATSSGFFGGNKEKGKVDPYHLIATGQIQRFRVDVESHIPTKSPFSFTGTTAFFNATTLHQLFARAPILQIQTRARSSSKSNASPHVTPGAPVPPLPGYSPSAANGSALPNSALAGSPLLPTVSNGTFILDPPKKKDRASTVSSLKITKIGLLSRKEDLAEGGKKAASRKWKGWSVVLTGSQLLFFKDPHFAASLQQALDAAAAASEPKPDDNHVLIFSIQTPFKPDAVLSLANSAAIYDSSYSKYRNVFRLVAGPAGRQYLFQAHDTDNLNSWMQAINYAASFKTANVRIRPLQPLLASPLALLRGDPTHSSPASASSRITPPFTAAAPPASGLPPQPIVQLADPCTLGSLTTTADAISPKSSLAPTEEDETIQPRGATSGHEREAGGAPDDPRSLKRAIEANGALPQPAPERTTPHASPRPAEASFAASTLTSVTARADLLRAKVNELDEEISAAREGLQADLRLARHLAILTPFRSTTRERVLTAIPPIEKRVRHARMHLAKLVCYREVLSRDLLVEDRDTERLIRKQSHHRTHSRRITRTRTPSPHIPASPRLPSTPASPHSVADRHVSHPRSTSSLRPPRASHPAAHSDTEHARHSFESTAESFVDAPLSWTDDETDRLRLRSPPLMQRSRTENGWQFETLTGGNALSAHGLPLHPAHVHTDHLASLHGSEDELEDRPTLDATAPGAGTPVKKRSTDPAEAFVRGSRRDAPLPLLPPAPASLPREESREVLTPESLAASVL